MLQIEDFIKRLEFLMEYFNLNASSFADKISVQRSSISHLLSGRNKPSLDFILKIVDQFPDLNMYWLLNGNGHFLLQNEEEITNEENKKVATPINKNELKIERNFSSKTGHVPPSDKPISNSENASETEEVLKKIVRIVCFYGDGTFSDFKPSE